MGLSTFDFLPGLRDALTIWLELIAVAVVASVLLSAVARGVSRRAAAPRRLPRGAGQPAEPSLAEQVRELRRYAEEITVVAQSAAVTASRRHDEWLAAQRAQDAAWRAYDAADTAARRAMAATAFPSRHLAVDMDELADRAEFLHRAATAAHQRGQLTARQLTDVLSHRNGWSPYRCQADQETTLCRIASYRLQHAYRMASAVERDAWHAAEIAAAAKRSLDEEAATATLRASQAANRLLPGRPTRRVRPTVRRVPRLATH